MERVVCRAGVPPLQVLPWTLVLGRFLVPDDVSGSGNVGEPTYEGDWDRTRLTGAYA